MNMTKKGFLLPSYKGETSVLLQGKLLLSITHSTELSSGKYNDAIEAD